MSDAFFGVQEGRSSRYVGIKQSGGMQSAQAERARRETVDDGREGKEAWEGEGREKDELNNLPGD